MYCQLACSEHKSAHQGSKYKPTHISPVFLVSFEVPPILPLWDSSEIGGPTLGRSASSKRRTYPAGYYTSIVCPPWAGWYGYEPRDVLGVWQWVTVSMAYTVCTRIKENTSGLRLKQRGRGDPEQSVKL